MIRLMMMMFSFIATTLMGIGVVIVLAMGLDTAGPIVISAAIGFVLAIPASWFVTKQIQHMKGGASLE